MSRDGPKVSWTFSWDLRVDPSFRTKLNLHYTLTITTACEVCLKRSTLYYSGVRSGEFNLARFKSLTFNEISKRGIVWLNYGNLNCFVGYLVGNGFSLNFTKKMVICTTEGLLKDATSHAMTVSDWFESSPRLLDCKIYVEIISKRSNNRVQREITKENIPTTYLWHNSMKTFQVFACGICVMECII